MTEHQQRASGITQWLQVALAITGMAGVAIVTVTRIEATTTVLSTKLGYLADAVTAQAAAVEKLAGKIDGQGMEIISIDKRLSRLEALEGHREAEEARGRR